MAGNGRDELDDAARNGNSPSARIGTANLTALSVLTQPLGRLRFGDLTFSHPTHVKYGNSDSKLCAIIVSQNVNSMST